ncbi:hypothetical protein [Nocardia wallacei]|uniref:hypothetical protein n=1 Tax=Nocardia wallacei TaxID=480035 RepID=UPI002457CE4F|nr:hypothetical protein [Nocardia wallacei]
MNENEIRDESARLVMNLTIMLRLGALGSAAYDRALAGDPRARESVRQTLIQLYQLGVSSPVARELVTGGKVK